jgi:hypothetical protein
MTVRADQFALCNLNEDRATTEASEIANLGDLFEAGKMIPRHRRVVKVPTTIHARPVLLELLVPLE